MSSKTEKPTPKRLREAREKGQVARSRTLTSAAAAASSLLSLLAVLPAAGGAFRRFATHMLSGGERESFQPGLALADGLLLLAEPAGAVLAAAALGAAVASVAQVGFHPNFQAIGLDFARIDPAAGLRRLFSTRAAFEVARGVLASTALLGMAYGTLRELAPSLARLPSVEASTSMGLAAEFALRFAGRAALALLALGALDFLYQRHRHMRDLMMSGEELKREHKESEGNPHCKAKRRALHRALAAGVRGVAKATCVVVNPTHVAVALSYDAGLGDAPVIAAKGRDQEALKIRVEARRHDVPIVKDIPLAWSLLRFDLGEEVPPELYEAVAAILRTVYELQAAENTDQSLGPSPAVSASRRSQ